MKIHKTASEWLFLVSFTLFFCISINLCKFPTKSQPKSLLFLPPEIAEIPYLCLRGTFCHRICRCLGRCRHCLGSCWCCHRRCCCCCHCRVSVSATIAVSTATITATLWLIAVCSCCCLCFCLLLLLLAPTFAAVVCQHHCHCPHHHNRCPCSFHRHCHHRCLFFCCWLHCLYVATAAASVSIAATPLLSVSVTAVPPLLFPMPLPP